jgi:hypothetical protein
VPAPVAAPVAVAVQPQPQPQLHPQPLYQLPPGYRQQPGARVAPTGQRPASMTLLYIWILLFGFVGTQLAWTLRPFFGDPGQDFAFFRSIEGNFYAEILATIASL